MWRFSIGLGGLALVVLGAAAFDCLGLDQPPASGVATSMVAMRDQVKLATDVYLPGDGKGKYPVVVARTPYGKSQGAAVAVLAKLRGYALVVQDLRGRGKSAGDPAIIFGNDGWDEHQDGRD